MSRNHRIAALVLILVLTLSGAAQALPTLTRSTLTPKADGIFAIVRDWFSGLAAMWGEAGSSMDPNGGGSTTDAGSDMDPNGKPSSQGVGDEGSDMDPNG